MPAKDRMLMQRMVTSNGCWEWTGRRVRGYGQVGLDGKQLPAHRAAYLLWRGPIPDGHDLHHLCHNRPCFNPWHVEPVPERKHLPIYHRLTHCAKGHEFTDDNIRMTPKGRVCRTCQNEYQRNWRASHPEIMAERRKAEAEARANKPPKPLKTHCVRGHPLSGDNLYLHPGGQRVCRQCSKDAGLRYKAKDRERWLKMRSEAYQRRKSKSQPR